LESLNKAKLSVEKIKIKEKKWYWNFLL
jgi:hypothetical protein